MSFLLSSYPNLTSFLWHTADTLPATTGPAFLEHLFGKIDYHITKKGKVLILTLTKKSAEEISQFFISRGYKTCYLHSEISTIERRDIIQKLRTWVIDILIGINLLREGIDLPEVSLIAILDADKEWFLRSTTSLIQIIWRAARNTKSEVILYADNLTESMTKSLRETYRRRHIQQAHNTAYWLTPEQAISNVKGLTSVKTGDDLDQTYTHLTRGTTKRLKKLTKKERDMIATDLKQQLDEAIKIRDFEKATILRDQLKELLNE